MLLNHHQALNQVKKYDVDFNSDDIISDIGLQKAIKGFNVGIKEQVISQYLTRGPCQVIALKFL